MHYIYHTLSVHLDTLYVFVVMKLLFCGKTKQTFTVLLKSLSFSSTTVSPFCLHSTVSLLERSLTAFIIILVKMKLDLLVCF